MEAYSELLRRPDVEYISVKISSVFSQINLAAFDHTVREIKARLRVLYRVAQAHRFELVDGRSVAKFINLDMEEYRDLHLTVAAFKQVLDEPEFKRYNAGIVLQAYLPDSFAVQQDLTEWAQKRVENGGAPIKIRIVKGANLAMEKVEAELHGWEQAPYYTKADVDANYKRMVLYGCQPEHAKAVRLGIASHNLFDIAFGLVVRAHTAVESYIEFEMLEGMANHQARAVQDAAGGLLLYAPVVKRDDFHSAIAYLVRRLDENTAEENFLHDLFALEVGSEAWHKQQHFFATAISRRDLIPAVPNRAQNRATERRTFDPLVPFANEADTDFSLAANQQWAADILHKWHDLALDPIPLQINDAFLQPNEEGVGIDTSLNGKTRYRYALARPEQIEQALQTAVAAQADWAGLPIVRRKQILINCATELANNRGDLIGAAVIDGAKTIEQADVEVSEAVDFASYYARAFDALTAAEITHPFAPFGTILLTPPWNFPIAIPTGGMMSALMAGNTVILKPAPEAVLVAWRLVNLFWQAGVPKTVLQFVPTTDDEVGRSLVTDERVDAVILTGSYETARLFLGWKPTMRLFAETSGKNSLIVSAMADHDQVIKDLVAAAFGHNGQKCSAASLAVLEAEVYDNPVFLRQLKDAAASLPVGTAWELHNKVTPLTQAPNPALDRAQHQLDKGESWLLEPRMVDDNPYLWSPGIKLGVKRGSFYHQNECFGPVLGLMRAKNVAEAIEIVNDSEFGLTSGIHTLDDREIALWRDKIEVGNGYVNRPTTGAIVQRQPFGGWKRSAFGTGAKAGGENYVLALGEWVDHEDTTLTEAAESYAFWWHTHFSQDHDLSEVLGESNVFRYRPLRGVLLRVAGSSDSQDLVLDIKRVQAAAQTCGVSLMVSVATEVSSAVTEALQAGSFAVETEAQAIKRLAKIDVERIRLWGDAGIDFWSAAHEHHVPVVRDGVVGHGRLELRHYLREQALSETTHRYGNIMAM